MGLRDEILEQPAAARRQLASSSSAIEAIARRLRDEPVDSVVIAARGTSDHAARSLDPEAPRHLRKVTRTT